MVQHFKETLVTLGVAIKANILTVLFTIISFFTPIEPLIIGVGLAILADTILGIYKAKKKGEKITSRKLSQIISKLLLYQGSVLTIYCLEIFILKDFVVLFTSIQFFLTKIVAVLLTFIEIKSCSESYEAITGINLVDKAKELKNIILRAKKEVDDIKD